VLSETDEHRATKQSFVLDCALTIQREEDKMQRISRTTLALTVASGVVAVVALAVGGGGPGDPVDTSRCLAIYFYLIQIVVLTLVICISRCNEDRNCEVRCVRLFFYLFILVNVLLLLCLLGERFL
jgi:hypothetical protein